MDETFKNFMKFLEENDYIKSAEEILKNEELSNIYRSLFLYKAFCEGMKYSS